jgi:hypothetical protein
VTLSDTIIRFSISFGLINLLRKPDIELDTHTFGSTYISKLKGILNSFDQLVLSDNNKFS